MSVVTVIDNSTTILITIDGNSYDVPKPFKMLVQGDYVVIIDTVNNQTFPILYSDCTNPATVSAAALYAAIHAFFTTGGPLPVGAATAAKQDVGNASLASILSVLQNDRIATVVLVRDDGAGGLIVRQVVSFDQDTGTPLAPVYYLLDGTPYVPVGPLEYLDYETLLAAILAKIIATPATEAKQDTGNTSLATIAGKDFATQATLAAILAKIIAAPATEAKQDSIITLLQSVGDQINQPSKKTGRTHVEVSIRITAPGTLYTVTPGKVFKMTQFYMSGQYGTVGYATIRDGGAAGTTKLHSGPTLAANSAALVNPSVFSEPLEFTTDVYFKQDVGTLTQMNLNFGGYEENP